MSQKREKRRRRYARAAWRKKFIEWHQSEPPRWRFISRWRWKRDIPIPPKEVQRRIRIGGKNDG